MTAEHNHPITEALQDDHRRIPLVRGPLHPTLVTLIVLALLLGGLYFWRAAKAGDGQAWQQQATVVTATIVSPRDVPVGFDAVGTLRAVREVTLAPEVAGRVSAIRFDAGSRVGANALLVQLFDAP